MIGKISNFREWLYEAMLSESVLYEAEDPEDQIINWGNKLRGKKYRDVPSDTLNWSLNSDWGRGVGDFAGRGMRPEVRKEIENVIASRRAKAQLQVQNMGQPQRTQQQQQPRPQDDVPVEEKYPPFKFHGNSKKYGELPTDFLNWVLTKSSWAQQGTLRDDVKRDIEEVLQNRTSGKSRFKKSTPPPKETPKEEPKSPDPIAGSETPKPEKSPILPESDMGPEQKDIDQQFSKNIKAEANSHIMINALAGTGKTTILKHLAWKYGNTNQKWLYLVFNTKNKVEAKGKFPAWVETKTTNSFLGGLLQNPKNLNKIPQTERMASLSSKKEKPIQKTNVLLDSTQFEEFMAKYGLVNPSIPSRELLRVLRRYDNNFTDFQSISNERGFSFSKQVLSNLKSIRYEFKKQVRTLVGLGKSFAADAKNREAMTKTLDAILEAYDFDTDLADIKQKISKYKDRFRTELTSALTDLMGYDFMAKDYEEEIKTLASWVLEQSMAGQSNFVFEKDGKKYNMGQYRDFDDDLWYSAMYADQLTWPHFDVVLADEVQDFNQAQKIMLKKLSDAGAKIVAVGDPNQSIYRFRGADAKAFSNVSSELSNASADKHEAFTLSLNYRSRPAVIDFVNKNTHVKNLKGGKKFSDEVIPGNPESVKGIADKDAVSYDDSFQELTKEKNNGKMRQTAYIARTNAPLVDAALSLLSRNLPFIIVGKDIAEDLIDHIEKMMKTQGMRPNSSASELGDKLEEFLEKETYVHKDRAAKAAYLQELTETTKALLSCLENYESSKPNGNIEDFIRWIEDRLSGLDFDEGSEEQKERDLEKYQEAMKKNPVVLTTAHKSKGLEFSRVYILRDDQFPHVKAKKPADLEQEANAKYVAYTRAMDELHVLELEGQPGYSK